MNKRVTLLLAASLVGLAAGGCSSGGGPAGAGTPSPPPPPASPAFSEVPSFTGTPPTIASVTSDAPITATVDPGSVARSGLPTGDARGRMKLALTGLGVVESEVTGRCEAKGDTTRLELKSSSGTKVVVALVAGGTSSVEIDDTGLQMAAALLPGDYQVAPPRLTAAARFQPEGSDLPGGRLDLDVTCAG
ncbi:hypothetical protein JOF41_006562 [Saccharothrix coeruleofusca]|uniref:hypothetical protein n=1 Tax=Saccharothrix coeruleofusca TaxID=33919 RepID=UPI001AE905A3|nr:hypothetical protein [Saccharothrix coeruleofusca]MBP2340384.1 hypothetical protein [Saccharothrix coeruleofusca]